MLIEGYDAVTANLAVRVGQSCPSMIKRNVVSRALGLGALAAAIGALSDLLLQYTPQLNHLGSHEYAYLLDAGARRMMAGHLIGVPAILGEAVAFWMLRRAFVRGHRVAAASFGWIAAAGWALAAAFHAIFAPIGLALLRLREHGASSEWIAAAAAGARGAHEALGTPVLLLIFLAQVVFLIAVARGWTLFARIDALASPLPILVVFFVVIALSPLARSILLPCGINLANALSCAWLLVRLRASAAPSPATLAARSSPSAASPS